MTIKLIIIINKANIKKSISSRRSNYQRILQRWHAIALVTGSVKMNYDSSLSQSAVLKVSKKIPLC